MLVASIIVQTPTFEGWAARGGGAPGGVGRANGRGLEAAIEVAGAELL